MTEMTRDLMAWKYAFRSFMEGSRVKIVSGSATGVPLDQEYYISKINCFGEPDIYIFGVTDKKEYKNMVTVADVFPRVDLRKAERVKPSQPK